MMLAGFLLLLLLTDGESSERNCSYLDVLNHLNLTISNTMVRPVKNYKEPTKVYVEVLLYAILDVDEKDQMFIPYIWTCMWWQDQYISWKPEDFCGIKTISLPTDQLWKPDITIEEMIEKDKNPVSPHLIVYGDSDIEISNNQVLITTCKMEVYKFPMDTHTCNLTFKSIVHSAEEIQLVGYLDSSRTTKASRVMMQQTQSEWLFVNISIINKIVNNTEHTQQQIVYTITMKRRSALYIVNFLLPVFIFLCLDFASFMISHRGGEKLSYKVTVLLAVTVLQLILNEILPSSSDRIPLIAVYCIGIFGLMMLSLLETILVMYLMGKDSASQDDEEDKDQSLSEDCGDQQDKVSLLNACRDINQLIHCASTSEVSPCGKPTEKPPVAKEESSSQLMDDLDHDFEKLVCELRELVKTLALLHNSSKEEEKPKSGHWTRIAKTLNKMFFCCYLIAASAFLLCMFFIWTTE